MSRSASFCSTCLEVISRICPVFLGLVSSRQKSVSTHLVGTTKIEIYVFLAPRFSIKLKMANIWQLLAISAIIISLLGLKVDCLDSFLGETRREFLSRPVSSRKFNLCKFSACLESEISVSNWVSIRALLKTQSLELSQSASLLSRILSRNLSRLDLSVSSRLVSAKTCLDPSLPRDSWKKLVCR